MSQNDESKLVGLDLNHLVLQECPLALQQRERHSILDIMDKIRQLTSHQIYRDNDLKSEKIASIKSPPGMYCLGGPAGPAIRIDTHPRYGCDGGNPDAQL